MPTFLTLQQELADRLNLDQAVNTTRLKRWLNLSQNAIASRYPFEFEYSRAYIQTQLDKTAGTVAVTNGGTSVTGTSTAFAAGDKRSFIQLEGDTNWYEVTVVAAQVLTITPAFAGTSLTVGTYTLRKVYYDLPADLAKVITARQSNTPAKLVQLGIWMLDAYQPDINTTGSPLGYYIFNQDPDTAVSAAKQTRVGFFPAPDGVYNVEFRYEVLLTDLSGDTDIPVIPQTYMECLLSGAEYLGAKFLNSPSEGNLKQVFELEIQKMIDSENRNGDYLPVLGSNDTSGGSRFLRFPSGYSQPG